MLGTSDAWSMSRSSQRTTEPAYYIVDCQISDPLNAFRLCMPGSATEGVYFSPHLFHFITQTFLMSLYPRESKHLPRK